MIDNYINFLLSKKEHLNIINEFSFLDRYSEHHALDFNLKAYLPVYEGIQILSIEQSLSKYGKATFIIGKRTKEGQVNNTIFK